jgi:hypothetical protein
MGRASTTTPILAEPAPSIASVRRLSIFAVVVALLSAATSSFALWRTYDDDAITTRAAGSSETEGDSTSTTDPLVVVPSQAGKDGLTAAAALIDVGLEPKISRKPSVSVPKDMVVSQTPVEGTRVPRGTVVELFLSSGPP